MSTDQRRYQVFVSSTYQDLREARQAVTLALLECDAFPAGMEIFPATDETAWTLIQRVIDESDYYLLVIAGKYGSVDETSGVSYTEMEYDYAVSVKKPVMAFLRRDIESLPFSASEAAEDRRQKLKAFCDKVKKAKHVKFWTSPEELAGQVSRAYNVFARLQPAIGWVRADQATSTESLRELIEAKAQVEALNRELRDSRISAPPGTEDLAQDDDAFTIPFRASAKYRIPDSGGYASVADWISPKTTWNALFGAIAPGLLQEAEEDDLHGSIQNFLLNEFLSELIDAALSKAKAKGHDVSRAQLSDLETVLHNDDFGTILVQLMALGLIRRSEKKRSVNDNGTYWALTPYGEHRTIQLRAIKKTNTEGTDSLEDDA